MVFVFACYLVALGVFPEFLFGVIGRVFVILRLLCNLVCGGFCCARVLSLRFVSGLFAVSCVGFAIGFALG